MKQQAWRDKISNAAQLGGIETSVLDNGAGRGSRIAWINTGSGLRYKVVIDRAMDIAEASYNQHNLSWISHLGITPPDRFSHRGIDWLRTFGGGLVTTCGLSHFGPPEQDESEDLGLHGRISNLPAEIESIVQPDIRQGTMDMSITGLIRETRLFGPSFELKRTISGKLGESFIRIHDEVVNVANTPKPHMLLYHCNFGWPLVDEGTDILWAGSWKSGGRDGDHKIFREGNDFRKCPAPMGEHKSGGEAVVFIDPIADAGGQSVCGLHNKKTGVAIALRFNKKQLPWLTNWQHWGKGEYVTGLEPGTNPPIGQARAREQNQLIALEPGEKRTYDLEFEVMDDEIRIREFLQKHKF
ncbi:MAG TPA: aldose 1-epimerase family protein [Chryseosolibacter sp.]|nr:aldose 1-epimerase family protein [Chryseosolibacter sp.]